MRVGPHRSGVSPEASVRAPPIASRTAALALLAGLSVVAFLIPRWVGFLPSGLYTADYVFLSDAARRVALGQVPHVDFSSAIGPLIPWLQSIAGRQPWIGPDFLALNALVWALAAVPAAVFCLTASSVRRAALLTGLAAIVTIVPMNVETVRDACEVNYNGAYNRYGLAFLVLTFGVSCDRGPRRFLTDVVLFSTLLGPLIALKITYALAALGLLSCAAVFDPETRPRLAAAMLFIAAVGAVAQLGSGITAGYLRDIAETARLNAGGMMSRLCSLAMSEPLPVLAAAAGMAIFVDVATGDAPGDSCHGELGWPWRQARLPALACVYIGLIVWTESQNTGSAGFVGLAATLTAVGQLRSNAARTAVVIVAALCSGPFVDQVLRRGPCVAGNLSSYATYGPLHALAPALRAQPGRWDAATIVADLWTNQSGAAQAAYRTGYDFDLDSFGAPVAFLADAIVADLAAQRFRQLRFDRPVRHVTTLDLVDAFTPLLGLEPARGLKIALDPGRTIGSLTQAQAASYLAPVEGVFERTCAVQAWQADLASMFRPALAADFQAVALTSCWTVHVRRGPPSQP